MNVRAGFVSMFKRNEIKERLLLKVLKKTNVFVAKIDNSAIVL